MKPLLTYTHFYLVGIQGVAMTSLAQCLLDAGKSVQGSDVAEEFVTTPLLKARNLSFDTSFTEPLPANTECVIYTAAHKGKWNPQVQEAIQKGLPTLSQAEAVAQLANEKKGIAVCGVGGKSTTSAMLTWMLEKLGARPSFSVGVGNIPGLDKTGAWSIESEYFVVEADEYVIDPSAPSRGEAITPRFSFLKPSVIICTNLSYDHPDVYTSFEHTMETYYQFFSQLKPNGLLIVSEQAAQQIDKTRLRPDITALTVGPYSGDNCVYTPSTFSSSEGKSTLPAILIQGELVQKFTVELQLPGLFNAINALQAITALSHLCFNPQDAAETLKDFRSTKRRAELIGVKNGVTYYDDYAHHPNELKNIIGAFREWYPTSKLVVAFQPHTFSRTKALYTKFVDAFTSADQVVMIDIFASAREPYDSSITSTMLCDSINQKYPSLSAVNTGTLANLATFIQENLKAGDVCLTVGAGDIYHVHELL